MTRSLPKRFAFISLCAVMLALAGGGASAAARRGQQPARVPQGFFGTVVGGPLSPGTVSNSVFTSQLDLMVSSGVESVRAGFDWAQAQPYRSWAEVPAQERSTFTSDGIDHVPTNFTEMDDLVGAASARGLTILPLVIEAPAWDGRLFRGSVMRAPVRNAPFAAFCAALVRRYGPHGTFWHQRASRLSIRTWEIWNEPNLTVFWGPRPFAPTYVTMLKAARSAILQADPGARIMLGGLANYSWQDLRAIYAVPGARNAFDVVGLHPYTKTPQGVIDTLAHARQIMQGYGDGAKPIIADEISWPSSLGKTVHDTGYGFATTEAGQARDITQFLPLLAANRIRLGLAGVYYYTWAGVERPGGLAFAYSGLLKYVRSVFVRKPAFWAFRHNALGLERCHAKATVATVCRQPY